MAGFAWECCCFLVVEPWEVWGKSRESTPHITIRSVTQAKVERKYIARDLGNESGVLSSPLVFPFSFHHLCTLLSWGLEQARFSYGRKFTLSAQVIKPYLVIVPQSRFSCEKERKNKLVYTENGKRQMGCVINSGFSHNDHIVWNVIRVFAPPLSGSLSPCRPLGLGRSDGWHFKLTIIQPGK